MVRDLSDRTDVVFDDERVVVNAGILLAVTLGRRLGIEGARRSRRQARRPAGGLAARAQGALAGPRDAARRGLDR